MLFLDGSTFAVIISLLVVLVPHCWVRSRSSEYMLSFWAAVNIVVISYLVHTRFQSQGALEEISVAESSK